MMDLTSAVAACLAGLLLATPAAADDDDRFKDARKRQREYEKRMREQQKKQEEWARERWEKAEELAREERKRQREFEREQQKWYEDQQREQYRERSRWDRQGFGGNVDRFGGYSDPHYPMPYGQPGYHGQSGYQRSGQWYPGGSISPAYGQPLYGSPAYGQPLYGPSTVRPYGFSGSVVIPSGRAYGFSGQLQVVPLGGWR
jgi:hypothetical protein